MNTIWIVIRNDENIGPCVDGVYSNQAAAEECAETLSEHGDYVMNIIPIHPSLAEDTFEGEN